MNDKNNYISGEDTENVAGCIVHRIVNSSTGIPADYLSADVQKMSLEKLGSSFVAGIKICNMNLVEAIKDDTLML